MTRILFEDFDERAKEVSQYFILLKNLEQESIKLSMGSKIDKPKIKAIDSNLLRGYLKSYS